jgi:murein DD-endopeptidase MepM/ murein hydrolase activator NlpD
MRLRLSFPKPSFAFFLQLAACGVVAWSLWNGGLSLPRSPVGNVAGPANATGASATPAADPDSAAAPAGTAAQGGNVEQPDAASPVTAAQAISAALNAMIGGPSASPSPAGDTVSGAANTSATRASAVAAATPGAALSGTGAAAPVVQLAGAPGFEGARLALSSIDVIVSRNDTLDRIFRRWKISLADLATLRALPGLKARLDSLHPGELLRLKHRDGELFGFERRLSDDETLKVVRADDGLKAAVVENPLETRTRTARGRIDSSLFEAVEAAGAHDQTAVALADIFGWDIDFVLDVRPGDTFAVTYEELWRDGSYLKDGPVLAASFVNQGREYRAVRYTDPDGATGYYNPDGRSVRRAFLRAPLEFSRVSSGFALARMHPILNRIRAHKGVDYAAPTGTPVRAAGDGTVRFAGVLGGYGNLIEIAHTRSITTVYGHLARFAHGIRSGTHVTQGTVIGYVGMTGLATGPHLHYEYRVNGVFKNPQTVPLPAAAPINPSWSVDFRTQADPLLASLDLAGGVMLVSR